MMNRLQIAQFRLQQVVFVIFLCLLGNKKMMAQSSVEGLWHGAFTVIGQAYLIDLTVDLRNSEVYLTNPESDSKIKNYGTNVSYENNRLRFEWPTAKLKFQGVCSEKGDTLKGKMTQNGLTWDMLFLRTKAEKPVILRPQEPKPPYAYRTETIQFKNERDGTVIHGIVTYPLDTTSNYPIVILDSGSGPQDRNGAILGHKPFLVLADAFAKAGIASFRFDDRGAGESTANYGASSLYDFASDVVASIDFLAKQKQFKTHKIGLLGHSEGGMHILIAQHERPKKVAFLVFLAAPGILGRDVLVQQQYEMPLKNGLSDSIARWNQELYNGMSAVVMREEDPLRANEQLRTLLREMFAIAPMGALDEGVTEEEFIAGNAPFLNNDWGRQFLKYDPRKQIRSVKVPLFFLYGGADNQVNPQANEAGIQQALSSKQRNTAEFHVVPGLNHLLQTCSTCVFSEYGELTETMSPAAIQLIVQFLQKQ